MKTPIPRTAHEALSLMRGRSLGALELIDAVIELCRASTLGAIEILDEEGAREQARHADDALARGEGGPLEGLPILVKDVIDVEGLLTRGGTACWRRQPDRDAASVAAVRAAGAIVIGKGHTNELAFGIDGRNPHRPPCLNPHDHDALPGGSSSGPAVALAGGLVLGALGTDTSGSIRVPAALCGVAGLRPTFERISLRGVQPLARSYDVVGPMASCVADLGVLFQALLAGAGRIPRQARVARDSVPDIQSDPEPGICNVLVIETLLDPGLCEPRVAAAVHRAAEAMRHLGLAVHSVSIAGLDRALAVHRDLQLPQAAESVQALGVPEAELGEEVRQRVHAAREISPERHARAMVERAEIACALDGALPPSGVLLAPGCVVPAPAREARELQVGAGPPRSIRDVLLSCTVPLTQSRGPVLSVPLGTVDGRPIGAQLLARPGWDEQLLDLGARLERELPTFNQGTVLNLTESKISKARAHIRGELRHRDTSTSLVEQPLR